MDLDKEIKRVKYYEELYQYDEALAILSKIKKNLPYIYKVDLEIAKIYMQDQRTISKAQPILLDLENKDIPIEKYEKFKNLKYCAKLELGKLEYILENYSSARKYFDEVLSVDFKMSFEYATLELIILELNLKNFEQAYFYLNKLLKSPSIGKLNVEKNLLEFKFFLETKLKKQYSKPSSYFEWQLVDYNIKYVISHIKKHLKNVENKKVHSIFIEGLNVENLVEVIENNLENSMRSTPKLVDKYIFNFNFHIGTFANMPTNKLLVTTIPHSKKILTAYPISATLEYKNENEIDIPKEKIIELTKRESQIDKFNKKYNI